MRSAAGTAGTDWTEWTDTQLLPALVRRVAQPHDFQQQAEQARKRRKEEQQREAEREEKEADEDVDQKAAEDGAGQHSSLLDVEELGRAVAQQTSSTARSVLPIEHSSGVQPRARPTAPSTSTATSVSTVSPRPMLTDQLRAALSKQGYKLIGSHSGVKLCRWTKAMLRGRGGCYKNTSHTLTHSTLPERQLSLHGIRCCCRVRAEQTIHCCTAPYVHSLASTASMASNPTKSAQRTASLHAFQSSVAAPSSHSCHLSVRVYVWVLLQCMEVSTYRHTRLLSVHTVDSLRCHCVLVDRCVLCRTQMTPSLACGQLRS